MKEKLLKRALKILTVGIINKYDPIVVAITGNVGKTSTKDAIYDILKQHKSVRKSKKNYNTEFGAPLVFFGIDNPSQSAKGWLKILLRGLTLLFKRDPNYPNIIVMEMAADRKGDIEYLTDFIKPQIGVVTAIGDVPVHIEYFEDVNELVKEKSFLVKRTKKEGKVVLNADDGRVFQMKGATDGQADTYGFSDRAEIQAGEISKMDKDEPGGIKFDITYKTEEHTVKLPKIIDEGSVYAILAAIGVGLSLDIPLYRLIDTCKEFKSPRGRMRLIEGMNSTWIIDSSYNAAPLSTELALGALKNLTGQRKIAVLGDMLELGDESEEAHREIGEQTSFLDILITVGEDSEYIGEEAGDSSDIFHFDDSEEAASKLKEILQPEDLILVKGSQAVRTEKVIEAIMKNKEKAEDLLVRQYPPWKDE